MTEVNPKWHPIIKELAETIEKNGWTDDFNTAIITASYAHSGIPEMRDITSLYEYLAKCDSLLTWVPSESVQGRDIYNALCLFYFVIDQPSLARLQPPIRPECFDVSQNSTLGSGYDPKDVPAPIYAAPPVQPPPPPSAKGIDLGGPGIRPIEPYDPLKQGKTWLSDWLVRYAQTMGTWMDNPKSLNQASLQTFYKSPNYNMDDYEVPPGGFKTFNQLFARTLKPGVRPIAAPNDPCIIVSAADSSFDGQWEIRTNSGITVKGMHWKVDELLVDSPYRSAFQNGVFMHAFLGPQDYHRQHAPVPGIVREARVIPGNVYLEVVAENAPDDSGVKQLCLKRKAFEAPDTPGYQFSQARGLIVIESPIGLVAVLPVGMAQVSSVRLSVKPGDKVTKGQEISYFQMGGSDYIMLFQRDSNVQLTATTGVHYKVGTVLGKAWPVEKPLALR